jgi:prepilin-type N-terminal cleavage/methylation domain-containing protein
MAGNDISINKAADRAFTLVELLVAIAILCLLCTFLFSIIDSSTKLWRAQTAKEDAFREIRAALSILSRDLGNAVPTTDASCFFSDTNKFAFLTSLSADGQRSEDQGDICTVGYSLEWGKTETNNPQEKECYALYRYIRFSNPTFSRTLVGSNSVSEIFTQVDGTSTVRELVARNLLSIRCTPYSTNILGELTAFSPTAANGMPDIFDLSFSAIGQDTATRLSTMDDWKDTNSTLIQQSQQSFSLRVHLRRPQSVQVP